MLNWVNCICSSSVRRRRRRRVVGPNFVFQDPHLWLADCAGLPERVDHVCILEQLLLVAVVEPLHQLFLVPLEVVQQDAGRGGGNLEDKKRKRNEINLLSD